VGGGEQDFGAVGRGIFNVFATLGDAIDVSSVDEDEFLSV